MLKKSISLFLLISLAFLHQSASLHKFYVSHYTVDYRNEALQITIKVFADDLEKVLRNNHPKLRIDEKQDRKILGDAIYDYYVHHLSFVLDLKNTKPDYVGYELEQDIVYVYLQIDGLKKAPQQIIVNCDALTSDFEDQVNLFKLNCGKIQETLFLNKTETSKTVK